MGRGVSRLSNANEVLYFDISDFGMYVPTVDEDNEIEGAVAEYDEFMGREDYDNFIWEIKNLLKKRYPSLYEAKGYEDENTFILENNVAEFAISEYSGSLSLSIRAKEDEHYNTNKGANWINQIIEGLKKALIKEFPSMVMFRIGGF